MNPRSTRSTNRPQRTVRLGEPPRVHAQELLEVRGLGNSSGLLGCYLSEHPWVQPAN